MHADRHMALTAVEGARGCRPWHAGTVKGLTSQQLEELDCHVILGNTYHLESRPGSQLVADMGGLHGFVGWPRGMLTDSGGFQVAALLWSAIISILAIYCFFLQP